MGAREGFNFYLVHLKYLYHLSHFGCPSQLVCVHTCTPCVQGGGGGEDMRTSGIGWIGVRVAKYPTEI